MLRRYRPRRPINGVLLTISAEDLLTQDDEERRDHAAKLRARIDELHKHLGMRAPIYVLMTKIDLLAGFLDYFRDINDQDTEQVWGVTFPWTGTEDSPLTSLKESLAKLEERINSGVLARLHAESNQERRTRLYTFPQQWTSSAAALESFLSLVFTHISYEEPAMVRGVYFTSAIQEGLPIDRVLGRMGRALGLDRAALERNRPTGRSFFINRLLRSVIFEEAGLAGMNRQAEQRRIAIRWTTFAAALLLGIALIAAWSLSYYNNQKYLEKVAAQHQALQKALRQRVDTLGDLLPILRRGRELA